MKVTVLLAMVCVVLAEDTAEPQPRLSKQEKPAVGIKPVVGILRNLQHNPDNDGSHSSDFEAENGIKFQFSGSQGTSGGATMVGVYSYPLQDGSIAEVTFVADENGYQPQSDLLPVAPAFPHPIPEFVLKQIAFAEEERKRQERDGVRDE